MTAGGCTLKARKQPWQLGGRALWRARTAAAAAASVRPTISTPIPCGSISSAVWLGSQQLHEQREHDRQLQTKNDRVCKQLNSFCWGTHHRKPHTPTTGHGEAKRMQIIDLQKPAGIHKPASLRVSTGLIPVGGTDDAVPSMHALAEVAITFWGSSLCPAHTSWADPRRPSQAGPCASTVSRAAPSSWAEQGFTSATAVCEPCIHQGRLLRSRPDHTTRWQEPKFALSAHERMHVYGGTWGMGNLE